MQSYYRMLHETTPNYNNYPIVSVYINLHTQVNFLW
jgi:hypothetical protein